MAETVRLERIESNFNLSYTASLSSPYYAQVTPCTPRIKHRAGSVKVDGALFIIDDRTFSFKLSFQLLMNLS